MNDNTKDTVITAHIVQENADKEYWKVSVTIVPYGRPDETETIEVQMNPDTIVCSLDGYGFKTYPWVSGDVPLNAVIASCKYLQWCQNQ